MIIENSGPNSLLIRAANCAINQAEFVKLTIEIADDLFARTQRLAGKEKTTIHSLVEKGLRLVLANRTGSKPKKLPPLITCGGAGLSDEFKDGNWDKIRTEIYYGRGT